MPGPIIISSTITATPVSFGLQLERENTDGKAPAIITLPRHAEDRLLEVLLERREARKVVVDLNNATRSAEIEAYASNRGIPVDQAIIQLVNSGLSHGG